MDTATYTYAARSTPQAHERQQAAYLAIAGDRHDLSVHMRQAHHALTERDARPAGSRPPPRRARLTACWLTPNRWPTSISVKPLT